MVALVLCLIRFQYVGGLLAKAAVGFALQRPVPEVFDLLKPKKYARDLKLFTYLCWPGPTTKHSGGLLLKAVMICLGVSGGRGGWIRCVGVGLRFLLARLVRAGRWSLFRGLGWCSF